MAASPVPDELAAAHRRMAELEWANDLLRGELELAAQERARAAKAALDADGVSLQQFNESAGGQVVFHLHFHVLPRWEGVSLKPPGGPMAAAAELEPIAAKIRAAL